MFNVLADLYGVVRSTVYRVIERQRAKAQELSATMTATESPAAHLLHPNPRGTPLQVPAPITPTGRDFDPAQDDVRLQDGTRHHGQCR